MLAGTLHLVKERLAMNHLFIRAGALLGGALIAGAVLAVNPATANGLGRLLRPDVTCSKPTAACVAGNNSGSGAGVLGSAASADGIYAATTRGGSVAATAIDTSSTVNNFGVEGYSAHGTGVAGLSISDIGISASSNTGIGMFAQTGTFGSALVLKRNSSNETALVAGQNAQGDVLDVGQSNGTFSLRVTNTGNGFIAGYLFTQGSCHTGCARTRDGGEMRVTSYAPREATPTIQFDGEANLVRGAADVALDTALAKGADPRAGYAVFLTAEGPSRGLHVARETAHGFSVRENGGGRSTIAFSYRIVARTIGAPASRLPIVTIGSLPLNLATRAAAR
jgi:hypothetical protein